MAVPTDASTSARKLEDFPGRAASPSSSYLVNPNRTVHKVNTLPAWARSLQDDDALFQDSSPSPTTTRASRPSGASTLFSNASSTSPLRPPQSAHYRSRTQRYADVADDESSDGEERSQHEHIHRLGWPRLNHHHDSVRLRRAPSDDTRRAPKRQGSGEESRPTGDWWQFTLPVKYARKVEEYMWGTGQVSSERERQAGTADPEKQEVGKGSGEGDGDRGPGRVDRMGEAEKEKRETSSAESRTARMPTFMGPFSANQAQTPGWSSPWQPFSNYRRDPFSELDHRDINRPGSLTSRGNPNSVWGRVSNFVLHSYMAPLMFRLANILFTSTSLGLASRIRLVESRKGLTGVIGSSTTFAIVVAPFSLVHILISVYTEYFGPPLGIWRVSSKMVFTLLDLVFISFWSAELSLAFDDVLTTPLACTSYTPNAQYRGQPLDNSQVEGTTANTLCDLQSALVSMVFAGVVLYTAVLVVSLFRIFNKVSRKT